MRRLNYLLIALVAVLVAAPVAWAQPIQTFYVKLTNNTAGEGTGFTLGGTTSMPDGSKPPGVRGFSITTPVGGKFNPEVATKCDKQKLENTGRCPKSSRIDKRTWADARVDFGPFGTERATDVKIYRASVCPSGTIACAWIRGYEPKTGVTVIMPVNVYMRGGAPVIDIPDTVLPDVLGVEPVITAMESEVSGKRTVTASSKDRKKAKKKLKKAKRKCKRKRGKKKRKCNSKAKKKYSKAIRYTAYLYTNPKKCTPAGWTTTLNINYLGGSSNTLTSNVPCKAAKKKKKK